MRRTRVLKLADFGLARTYLEEGGQKMTNRVITLWYRCARLPGAVGPACSGGGRVLWWCVVVRGLLHPWITLFTLFHNPIQSVNPKPSPPPNPSGPQSCCWVRSTTTPKSMSGPSAASLPSCCPASRCSQVRAAGVAGPVRGQCVRPVRAASARPV